MADQSHIVCIIMPPGCGKSHLHSPERHLLEADTVLNCRATDNLKTERLKAKQSGCWTDYDRIWGAGLKSLIPGGNWVLMVPSHELAHVNAWPVLGAACLTDPQWEKNLSGRVGSVDKYSVQRKRALDLGADLFETNDQLQERVYSLVKTWLSQVE